MSEYGIRRETTDYGFVLVVPTVDGYDLEAYGMAGIGRYELFYSCGSCEESELPTLFEEAANKEEVHVYRETMAALGKTRRASD